jgi:hypothetical protein
MRSVLADVEAKVDGLFARNLLRRVALASETQYRGSQRLERLCRQDYGPAS